MFDKASGRYFDEAKMHVLDHQGRFFKVRGPLNVAGMPQGHPVMVAEEIRRPQDRHQAVEPGDGR